MNFTRRVILIVVIANVLAAAFAGGALLQSYTHSAHRAQISSQNLVHVLERTITMKLDRIDDTLLALADDVQRQRGDDGSFGAHGMSEAMLAQFARTPGILGLRITDAAGRVIHVAGAGGNRFIDVGDRDYFRALKDDPKIGLAVSSLVFGRATDEWLIILARRLNRADGSFDGIVYAPVSLTQFERELSVPDLGQDGAVSLRDLAFNVVARYPSILRNGGEAIGNNAVSPELQALVRESPLFGTYVARAGLDGVERVLSYRKTDKYPFYVIVGLALDEYMQRWRYEANRVAAFYLMFLAMTVLFTRWLNRNWRSKEQALEQTSILSARLQAVLGNTPVGLAIVDHQRRVSEANAALSEIFGIEVSELVGQSTEQMFLSREQFEDLGIRAYPLMHKGATFRDILQMKRRNGEEFWCGLSGRMIEPGNPELGMVWVAEDVSERRMAEDALRASEERFRVMVDGVRDYAIYRVDPAGIVETWNIGAETITGYRAQDVIGRHISIFFRPGDVASGVPTRMLDQAARQGRYEEEGWRIRKDGSRFWASVLMTALHDANGRVRGFVKITRDFTERRAAEAEIRRLGQYQKAILENSPVGIAILDFNRIITHCNQAFARTYGREGENLVGESAAILYADPDQFREVGERAYPLVRGGGTFSDDVSMVRRDGVRMWVRVMAHMIDPENPEMGVIWAVENITLLKELNDNLVRSNAELERFAYVASHDLRQPLRTVGSYVSLIERQLKDHPNQDIREFLAFAVGGVKRMDAMIVDLLEYSRIGRGAAFTDVSLADVLDLAILNLKQNILEADAQVVAKTDLPMVKGSLSELERLFQNLIGNAVKFRLPDRSPRIEVSCLAVQGEWRISVSDNGIGIDPEHHQRLFNIFSRLVSQDKYEGTGIGLAACRKVVEHHGGRIWVESQAGAGSVFTFTLPMAHADLSSYEI